MYIGRIRWPEGGWANLASTRSRGIANMHAGHSSFFGVVSRYIANIRRVSRRSCYVVLCRNLQAAGVLVDECRTKDKSDRRYAA